MNLVLDTHIWVRWLCSDQPLDGKIINLIEEAETLAVSSVSCWEVAYLTKRKRIEIPLILADWVNSALEGSGVEVIDLSSHIAVLSAELPAIRRLSLP